MWYCLNSFGTTKGGNYHLPSVPCTYFRGDCFQSVWWKDELYLKFRRNFCRFKDEIYGRKVGLCIIFHVPSGGQNYPVFCFDRVTFLSSCVAANLLYAWCFWIIHSGNQMRSRLRIDTKIHAMNLKHSKESPNQLLWSPYFAWKFSSCPWSIFHAILLWLETSSHL